ncbi:DUF4124 domain-containing protein [Endozoicomonas sp.]|uniref:DUF4124 domain-containing protein n=1 Tax=Endozoicomonas sp. TaxID=1892382 RepID=UPI003AF56A5D
MNIKKAMVQSFLAVILPMILADLALAAIYKTVDKDGNIIFTDSRPADQPSEEVQLRPITPMSSVPTSRPGSSVSSQEESEEMYSLLEIVEPANDATVRSQGNFTVRIATEPRVLSGHRIRLLLDGDVVGESKRKLSFELKNIDRGTHTLTVEIVDNRKKVVQSSNNTIHVHRTTFKPAVSINPPSP